MASVPNLGHGVGPIRALERAREQDIFGHRLDGIPRVNATTTEVEQLCGREALRRVDHIGCNCQIVVDELAAVGAVCEDVREELAGWPKYPGSLG